MVNYQRSFEDGEQEALARRYAELTGSHIANARWTVVNMPAAVQTAIMEDRQRRAYAAVHQEMDDALRGIDPYRVQPPARSTRIYTLCGSSRFPEAFHLVNAHLSMKGHIVISLGLFGHADEPRGARFLTSDGNEGTTEKQLLDELHFRKIEASDAIFVINVGGYVGSSTKREIEHAKSLGKIVEWLFP